MRRQGVAGLREHHGVSERRAGQALGVDCSVVRYRPCRGDDAAIQQRLRSLEVPPHSALDGRTQALMTLSPCAPAYRPLPVAFRKACGQP